MINFNSFVQKTSLFQIQMHTLNQFIIERGQCYIYFRNNQHELDIEYIMRTNAVLTYFVKALS